MYEVEVKVRGDHERVRDRLAAVGAERIGSVRQKDTYYDAPHRSFAETDEALRLRRERTDAGASIRLTYKGPLVETASKTREELETAIEDGDAADAILQTLGFDPVAVVRKDRERYAVAGYTVALDDVDGLGEFVEVETEGDAEAIEPLREGAVDLLCRLDLDPDDHLRTSYLELLLESDSTAER